MTSSKPRIHKDLDHAMYVARIPDQPPKLWDMRYDPRERNNKFNAPRFPYNYTYYGPRTAAFLPRINRLCILFRYDPSVRRCWAFDIIHRGPPTGDNGYAITAEDVLGGIYDHLQLLPDEEDRSFSNEHNKLAEKTRQERCALLGLDPATEPVRRIDYLKGVRGYCAFAGLDGYNRHLATPTMRVYRGEVPPRGF